MAVVPSQPGILAPAPGRGRYLSFQLAPVPAGCARSAFGRRIRQHLERLSPMVDAGERVVVLGPDTRAALAAALMHGAGPGLDGSSCLAVQQWAHDFDAFDAMTDAARDAMVGRHRGDSVEMDDAPPSAHVKRTAQESFTPEAFVLRRSMPWAAGRDAGLMFVSFGCSPDGFEAQLRRMVGLDDGIADALFGMWRPLTGAYSWCPQMRDGVLDLRALVDGAGRR